MSENWLPVRRRLTHRVEVSPADHVVVTVRGAHRVAMVSLTFESHGWDGEWADPLVLLSQHDASMPVLRREELIEVPAWLLDIECRAQPMNP